METNTELRSLFAKMVKQYEAPRTGLLSFFTTPRQAITDALRIEYDKQRFVKLMSKAKNRGDKPDLNNTLAGTNVGYQPPVYKEAEPFNLEKFEKRVPGEKPFSAETRIMRMIAETADSITGMTSKILRARIWQATQVFTTGKIGFASNPGFASPGVSDIDFNAPTAHFATVTTTWDNATAKPLQDLETQARVIRRAGGKYIKDIVFGYLAWSNFIQNSKVKEELDNRKINLGNILPKDADARGMSFMGQYYLDGRSCNLWVYDETFISPNDDSTEVEYLDPKKVVLIGNGEYTEFFAGIDTIKGIQDKNLQQFIPANGNIAFTGARVASSLYVDTYKNEELNNVFLRVQTAPLTVPKTNNTFGTLTVLS